MLGLRCWDYECFFFFVVSIFILCLYYYTCKIKMGSMSAENRRLVKLASFRYILNLFSV